MPLIERNALLAAAGLPSAFPAAELADDSMAAVRLVLEKVLAGHEPYPAWVIGRGLRFLRSNRGAEALSPGMCSMPPEMIVDAWFGPGPFRELVDNWQDVAWAGIAGLRREATRTADADLMALVRRAEAHAAKIPRPEGYPHADLPVVCPRLRLGDRVIRTISSVMRFDTAIDVNVSDLRVELMFPADAESDEWFRGAAQGRVS